MSALDTAEYRRLALLAAGVDPSEIPCILDTATWRRLMIAALYDLSQGGGGSPGYVNGSVRFYADLPVTVGTPAVNTAYLVREDSGIWFVNRKPAGIYVRLFNNGTLADWDYAGEFPSVNDSQYFRIYDTADPTREIAFSAASISSGQTRTLTVPDASGRIQIEGQPIGDTTPAAITATNLTANTRLALPSSAAGTPVAGDLYRVTDTLRYRDSSNTERLLLNATDNLSNLANTATARTNLGLGSSSAVTFGSLAANNGTLTASAPVLDLEQTWTGGAVFVGNTSGGTLTVTSMVSGTIVVGHRFVGGEFPDHTITGLGTGSGGVGTYTISFSNTRSGVTWTTAPEFVLQRQTVTDTASSARSKVQSFNVSPAVSGQTETFAIFKNGDVKMGLEGATGSIRTFISSNGAFRLSTLQAGASYVISDILNISNSARAFRLRNDMNFAWGGSGVDSPDVILQREAAGTLGFYNGANPQTFNIYNTYTSATNHERGFLRWSSNVFQIGTEKGSGGGTARALELSVDGNRRFFINASGQVGVGTTTGLLASNGLFIDVPSNSSSLTSPTVTIRGSTAVTLDNGGDPILRVQSSRVMFSGTTSSFPALKRSSTTLQVRLADDSAFAPLQCSALLGSDNGTVATLGSSGEFRLTSTGQLSFASRGALLTSADGVFYFLNNAGTDFGRLAFGGTSASFPALKRSSTVLQARLANDSDFAPLQGQLRTHANAVTETITADKTLTLYDAAGTAYKVPCVAA